MLLSISYKKDWNLKFYYYSANYLHSANCQTFTNTLREKCPDTEFFWSVFSCIRTEYGDLGSKYRKIRTRKNSLFGHFSRIDM